MSADRRLHVALFSHGFPERPDGSYTPAVIDWLTELGREVDITVFAVGHRPRNRCVYDFENLHVVATGRLNGIRALYRLPWLALKIYRLRRQHPDLLLHGIWHVGGLWAAVAGTLLRRPVIVSLLGGELADLPEIGYGVASRRRWQILLRRVLRTAHRVTVGSEFYRGKALAFLPEIEWKLRRIPLGIRRQKFSGDREMEPASPVRLLCVAALQPVKNLPRLMECLSGMPQGAVECTLAGEGPLLPRLQQLRQNGAVNGQLRLAGWEPPDRFRRRYFDHDALISLSLHEAQGMALIEAAAAGMPLFATAVGVAPELKRLGAAVELLPDPQAPDLPERLREFLRQLPQLQKQAARAREKIFEAFDLKSCSKKYLDLYRELQQAPEERPWYAVRVPLYMRLTRRLRPLVFLFWWPVVQHLRKRNAPTRVAGLRLHTSMEVFHPRWFFSSRMLARYMQSLPLGGKSVLDLGTGSGILGIVAAKMGAAVTAVDIHPLAVQLAARNAALHEVPMQCLESDLFANLQRERFDFILFNPPFYRGRAASEAEQAFYGGERSEVLQRFFATAQEHLRPEGRIVLILSSDADLPAIHRMMEAGGWRILAHHIRNHWFEQFHLLELQAAPLHNNRRGEI